MHACRSLDSGAADDAHLHTLLQQKLHEPFRSTARNACIALGALCHAAPLPPQPPVDTAHTLLEVLQDASRTPSTAAGVHPPQATLPFSQLMVFSHCQQLVPASVPFFMFRPSLHGTWDLPAVTSFCVCLCIAYIHHPCLHLGLPVYVATLTSHF